MIAVGVHFLPDDPPETIARKALRVNLSDLAAKGAAAFGYVLSAGLPADIGAAWLEPFAEGLAGDQARFGVALLGGDTITVPHGPVFSVTAFGTVPTGRMVHRSGGKTGDAIYVSGEIGGSTAGLALLLGASGPWSGLPDARKAELVARYRVPEPRSALADALLDFASCAMDVSDGLVGDCDKLAGASGCSAMIDADAVPLPAALAPVQNAEDLATLLTGGEDFEILAAVGPEKEAAFRRAAAAVGVEVARIGEMKAGTGPTVVLSGGAPLPLKQRAYVHGRGGAAQ